MGSAIRAVTMPKWGLSMEEGMVVAWHVAAGVEVAVGDDLLDIETTKITNVLESPAEGVLRRQVAAEGETLPVGAIIGVLAEASVPEAEIDSYVESFQADFAVKAEEAAAEAPQPRIVDVGGRPINLLEMGEGAAGEAPLVLVHGFGGDLGNWMFNQLDLAADRRVLAFDLPGHGASTKDVGDGTLESLAGCLEGLLDAEGIERAHLAGHSLGGGVALASAARRPGQALSLSLLAPAGLGPEINGAYIDGFVAAGRRREMKTVVQDLFADPALVSRDMVEELLRYKRLDGVAQALVTLAGALFPGGRQATLLRDRLADLDLPVQVIWGAEDRIIPVAQAEGLPGNVQVHRLDGAGHMVHMEAAGEVNRLIGALIG